MESIKLKIMKLKMEHWSFKRIEMNKYSKKGLYSAYDKNHSEREKNDYYSTPKEEVTNILNILNLDFKDSIILEPSCGGGHMVQGILEYQKPKKLIYTDIKDRGFRAEGEFYQCDYLLDDYPIKESDWIIMNPPFKLIEPFCIRSLEIAKKGIIMFGRLQFLEGEGRYENILKDNPPSDVYVYVDRVACYKNGDTSIKPSSIQAYAWYVWDKNKKDEKTVVHWIRRYNK